MLPSTPIALFLPFKRLLLLHVMARCSQRVKLLRRLLLTLRALCSKSGRAARSTHLLILWLTNLRKDFTGDTHDISRFFVSFLPISSGDFLLDVSCILPNFRLSLLILFYSRPPPTSCFVSYQTTQHAHPAP